MNRAATLSLVEQDAFVSGLSRVARPIEHNVNYHEILGNRLTQFFQRYGYDTDASPLSPDDSLAILDRSMVKRRNAMQMVPPSSAVAWGKTRNNLREFNFLRRILRRNGLDDRIFNVSHYRIRRSEYISSVPYLPELRALFREYMQQHWPISPAAIYQLINYVHAYVNWTATFHEAPALPQVLVLANDHSPNQVASMAVAAGFKLPTIYIQHAEVTTAFPPLAFSLSILRNHASLKAYESIGATSGAVHIVSRDDSPFEPARFAKAVRGPVHVGIYLTAQVVWQGVRDALEKLRSNGAVASVFVKPHPSQPLDDLTTELPGVAFQRDIPSEPHIAVVANSSVVVELLHKGNIVFQHYGMDSVPRDYYGFSQRGISPEVGTSDLEKPFWLEFSADDSWRTEYAQYDPWALSDYSDNEKRLTNDLAEFFPPSAAERNGTYLNGQSLERSDSTVPALQQKNRFSRHMLELVPGTVLDYTNESSKFAPKQWCSDTAQLDFVAAMESVFADRASHSYDLFATTRRIASVSCDLVYASKRRDMELSGRPPASAELDEMTAYLAAREFDPAVSWTYYIEFLNFLLRLQEDERINHVFSSLPPLPVKKLGINRRISMIKWLRDNPQAQIALNLSPPDLYSGLDALQRLKLKTLSATDSIYERNPWSHEQIEQAFHKYASPGVQQEFADLYLPFYEQARTRMTFMDVRWSQAQRRDFYSLVKNHLEECRPFALVRLSDREAYMFADEAGRYFTQADVENCERHWWRIQLSKPERSELAGFMREAAEQADVLGVPCVYRLQREIDAKSKSLLTSLQVRGLAEVIHNLAHRADNARFYTEEKSNIPLFSDFEDVLQLCKSARRVVLVASANEIEAQNLFINQGEFKHIAIPTHSRTMNNVRYANSTKSLPEVYRRIRDEITANVAPGDLVLVAAGIIGKIFAGDAKQAGGVALDIGTCLDAWVGARIQSLH